MGAREQTGAEVVLRSAAAAGIEVCFANPGTTELGLVAALDRVPEVRAVLGLFEGVLSGAADGYARMARRPALGVYHLGPGFVNALANVHNARRAQSPMVNVIGDQATWHLAADAPLTSDVGALGTWAGSVHAVTGRLGVEATVRSAIRAATRGHGHVASVVLPSDVADAPGPAATAEPVAPAGPVRVPAGDVDTVARALMAASGPVALVAGGAWLTAEAQADLARVAAAVEAEAWMLRTARVEQGGGRALLPELSYFPEPARAALADVRTCVLAGVDEPVTFFGYEGQPSALLPDDCERLVLAGPDDDVGAAAADLAAALGAPAFGPVDPVPLDPAAGPLHPGTLGRALALALPEEAVVVQESLTSGLPFRTDAPGAAPFTLLTVMGGAIGGGLPTAVGAAVACPDRRVVAFQADGSAMYTIQSLWTAAREGLDVTVVLANNGRYKILETELARAGIEPGPVARSLTSLRGPDLDFTALAAAQGVPGERVDTTDGLVTALDRRFAEPGPHLVEVMLG